MLSLKISSSISNGCKNISPPTILGTTRTVPLSEKQYSLTSLGSGAYRVLKDLFLLDKYKDFWPACNAAEWLLLAHWLVSRRERPILFCKSETGANHRGVCERVKKVSRENVNSPTCL